MTDCSCVLLIYYNTINTTLFMHVIIVNFSHNKRTGVYLRMHKGAAAI